MNKFFGLFCLANMVFSSGFAIVYNDEEDIDRYRKEVYDRRLQDRLFDQRRATELPYERDYEINKEKKEAQGWDDRRDDWVANDAQSKSDAYKRQEQEVQQKQLEQKRIEDKILQQKLEQKRVEDRIYQQQLENKRLDDARYRRKLEDRDWDRRHGR